MSAVERLLFLDDTFEECSVIGRHEMRQVELINTKDPKKGVQVTYTGGRMCSSLTEDFINARKQITLKLNCAETQDAQFRLLDALNEYDVLECHAYLEIDTPAGCPQSIGWMINAEDGQPCMDAIPHKWVWGKMFGKCKETAMLCYGKTAPLARKRDNYETV